MKRKRRNKKMTDAITTPDAIAQGQDDNNFDKENNGNGHEKEQIIEKPWRRLVIITGDKGGVGKSTFARGLVQTYLDAQKSFVGFDADISNSQLVRFYGSHCQIEKLNIFKEGGIDMFFNKLKTLIKVEKREDGNEKVGESLFLLELPPQSRVILQNFVEDMTFLETAQADYEIRVTMVVVISQISDSVNQLIHLHSFCQNFVDYLIVKNLHFGEEEDFTIYKDSKKIESIKTTLTESKTPFVEINMPNLITHAYKYLDENNMTFNAGIEQLDNPAVKGRTRGWLRKFKEQIKPAQAILGLDGVELG